MSNFNQIEHQRAMEAARTYGQETIDAHGKKRTLHFIASIEDGIERCFEAADKSGNQIRKKNVMKAQHAFMSDLNALIRLKLREMDIHGVPPTDHEREAAVEEFINSIENVRSQTASNAFPSNVDLRRQTYAMLDAIEPAMRDYEARFAQKMGRMGEASNRTRSHAESLRGKLLSGQGLEEVRRRKQVQVALGTYDFDPVNRGWFPALNASIESAARTLYAMNHVTDVGKLRAFQDELDDAWKPFCDAALAAQANSREKGKFISQYANICRIFDQMRGLIPEGCGPTIPNAGQFSVHKERLLDHIGEAIAQAPSAQEARSRGFTR